MEENIHEKTENKIIDIINQTTNGRLVIFKPENSDKDLAVEKRGSYNIKPIFLKIYVQDALLKKQDYIKETNVENLDEEDNFYLIFAYFDVIKQDIEDAVWFVPYASFALWKNSDFSKFLIGKEDIGKILLEKLEE